MVQSKFLQLPSWNPAVRRESLWKNLQIPTQNRIWETIDDRAEPQTSSGAVKPHEPNWTLTIKDTIDGSASHLLPHRWFISWIAANKAVSDLKWGNASALILMHVLLVTLVFRLFKLRSTVWQTAQVMEM